LRMFGMDRSRASRMTVTCSHEYVGWEEEELGGERDGWRAMLRWILAARIVLMKFV